MYDYKYISPLFILQNSHTKDKHYFFLADNLRITNALKAENFAKNTILKIILINLNFENK